MSGSGKRRTTRSKARRDVPSPRTIRARPVARARAFPCVLCGAALKREPRGRGHGRGTFQIVCPRCRFRIYDYPRVCVGFLVVKRGQLLLLTRGEPPRHGCIDLPGGFLESGEDLETAARRELFEETGLRVGRASLLGLYWDRYDLPGFGGFPTLNYYWLARWRSGTPRAADDAAEAHWVPLEEVRRPSLQRRFAWAHMREVMRDLMRGPKRGTGRRGPG